MDSHAESSSRADQRPSTSSRDSSIDPHSDHDAIADAANTRAQERRLDAKRKRIIFLDHLLRELDTLVFLELIALYHLDCSFFWFAVRAAVHASLLTPLPDVGLHRQHDEHKPFLPMVLLCFALNFLLHLSYPAPSAGEESRGYLHGGLMIDFIGQQGPTDKWKLAALDMCILLLQLVMVSVHVKRRQAKKTIAQVSAGSTEPNGTADTSVSGSQTPEQPSEDLAPRGQDADAEERGVLRRTDTLSDIGAHLDEEETLLPSADQVQSDALDVLISGQCIVGDFTLIDTLISEHQSYQAFRQTRADTGGSSSLSPTALRQLQTIRMRLGVGGG